MPHLVTLDNQGDKFYFESWLSPFAMIKDIFFLIICSSQNIIFLERIKSQIWFQKRWLPTMTAI